MPITTLQASFGMKICGLKILNEDGNSISFLRSFFRIFVMFLISGVFFIILIPLSFLLTSAISLINADYFRGEISNSIPKFINAFSYFTLFAMFIPSLYILRNSKAALHDSITKTYVVYASSLPQTFVPISEKLDPNILKFANFWKRIGAFILDCLLIIVFTRYVPVWKGSTIYIILVAFYFIVTPIQWQGTVGMNLLKIKIINVYGNNISMIQSCIRFFSSCIPLFILFLVFVAFFIFSSPGKVSVYLSSLYEVKPQIPQYMSIINYYMDYYVDDFVNTLDVNYGFFQQNLGIILSFNITKVLMALILVLPPFGAILLRNNRRAFHDSIANTYVVCKDVQR